MPYHYTAKTQENEAKAAGIALPISTKFSIEVCNQLRGKQIEKAKKFLEDVIALKKPVPMKRFNREQAHRRGIAAGRFPAKCCSEILKLLKSAEANAQFSGLSTADMVIKRISAQQGPKTMKAGRKRRIQAKRTHIEVILAEQKNPAKQDVNKNRLKNPANAPKTAEPKKAEAEQKKSEPQEKKKETAKHAEQTTADKTEKQTNELTRK